MSDEFKTWWKAVRSRGKAYPVKARRSDKGVSRLTLADGREHHMETDHVCYFETEPAAYDWLCRAAVSRISRAEDDLANAKQQWRLIRRRREAIQ